MFDFSSIMSCMGYEETAVVDAFSNCAALIEGVREIAIEKGYKQDIDSLTFDFDGSYPDDAFAESVKAQFLDNLYGVIVMEMNDLTNNLVLACYKVTVDILHDTDMFTMNGIEIEPVSLVNEMTLLWKDGIISLGYIDDFGNATVDKICETLGECVPDRGQDGKDITNDTYWEMMDNVRGGVYRVVEDVPYGTHRFSVFCEDDKVFVCLATDSGEATNTYTRREFLGMTPTDLEKSLNETLYYGLAEKEETQKPIERD